MKPSVAIAVVVLAACTFLSQTASAENLLVTETNRDSFIYLGGRERLACFVETGGLGTLSRQEIRKGARFRTLNFRSKHRTLKTQIRKTKASLKMGRYAKTQKASLLSQLAKLKRRLNEVTAAQAACRRAAQGRKRKSSSSSSRTSSWNSVSSASSSSVNSSRTSSSSSSNIPQFAASVSQYGITWSFNTEYRVGQFVNGDWWVIGPVTITGMTPDFTGTQNGFEVNPSNLVDQGFDSRAFNFNAALVPALPISVEAPGAIVKAISKADGRCSYNTRHTCYLETAAVLTVLSSVPPDEGLTSFRPGYFDKEGIVYSAAPGAIRTEKLLSLKSPVAGTPALAELTRLMQRLQLDHKLGWTGRDLHPQDNMFDYGADLALTYDEAALRLMLNDSSSDKMPLLIGYIQAGIDHYSILKNGGAWWGEGGHGVGRKLPIAMAAVLLDDPAMKQAVFDSKKTFPAAFDEDGGVVYSARANNGGGKALFGQSLINEWTYWNVIRFNNAGGSKTLPDPYGYIDGCFRPGQSYDSLILGSWKGASLAAQLMPEVEALFNNSDFFDHTERRVTFGSWTQPDVCAPMDGTCVGGGNAGGYCNTAGEDGSVCYNADESDGYCNSYCPQGYCDYNVNWPGNYGRTYGPDGQGDCIIDTNPADGIGRFPLRHGSARDEGVYQSAFVNSMWALYHDYAAGNPIAGFTLNPRSGYIPLEVTFDASASSDTDGSITGYSWDFGDGTSGSGKTAIHTYHAQGAFQVKLTVADNSGKTATATESVMVGDPAYVHEDFELMTDITKRLTPYGMDFEAVSGNGTIGRGDNCGIASEALLLPNFGAGQNMVISKDGRNAWSNYTLNATVGAGYVAEGGIVLHYQDSNNYYLLNLGSLGGRLERVAGGVKTVIQGTGGDIGLPWNRSSARYTIYSTVNGTVNFVVVKDGAITRSFSDANPLVTKGGIGLYAKDPGQFNFLGADDIDLRIAAD